MATVGFPTVEVTEATDTKFYGIYMDGQFRQGELVAALVKNLPLKVVLPCGNFRWFSNLHYNMLSDMPCECGAPYEHYFIKWQKRRRRWR